jgi:hypothetical protein
LVPLATWNYVIVANSYDITIVSKILSRIGVKLFEKSATHEDIYLSIYLSDRAGFNLCWALG